jgi:hypothetical protein
MSLKPFSASVDGRFRVKLALDTNLLMYLLDESYPKLNEAILHLGNYKDFVDLITNRYTLFELYEKRKEVQFVRSAAINGFSLNAINSDKCYVHNKLKYERIFSFISFRKLLGAKVHQWINKKFSSPKHKRLIGEGLFFSEHLQIMELVKAEIPKIENEFGVEIAGSLHDNVWGPTFELIFNSRISREDSLIAMSFLKPDPIRAEKNLVILTNDGDFRSFYEEAKKKQLIEPLFDVLGIAQPTIDRITGLKRVDESKFNLKTITSEDVDRSIVDYIKKHIIDFNFQYFLGFTDQTIAPRSQNIIGLKIKGPAQYNAHQNLLFIGGSLDYIYQLPYGITEFRDYKSNSIQFPLRAEHNRVCYQHTALPDDDPDKQYEAQILASLKKSGNMVFIHPDSVG